LLNTSGGADLADVFGMLEANQDKHRQRHRDDGQLFGDM
jgi:hypothetical protein